MLLLLEKSVTITLGLILVCSVAMSDSQRPPAESGGSQTSTKRHRWTPAENVLLATAYCIATASDQPRLGYLNRMLEAWLENGGRADVDRNYLGNQWRYLKRNNYFSDVELERIRGNTLNTPTNHVADPVQAERHVPEDANPSGPRVGAHGEERVTDGAEHSESQWKILTRYRLLLVTPVSDRVRLPKPKGITTKNLDRITSTVNKDIIVVAKKLFPQNKASFHELDSLAYSGAVSVLELSGNSLADTSVDPGRSCDSHVKPVWLQRLQLQVQHLRTTIARLTCMRSSPSAKHQRFWRMYKLVTYQQLDTMLECLKSRLLALAGRISRYKAKLKFRINNRLFSNNEKAFYNKIRAEKGGGSDETAVPPELPAPQAIDGFWRGILSVPADFKQGRWYERQFRTAANNIQPPDDAHVTLEMLQGVLASVQLWKAPGVDGVAGYWWKRFTALHGLLHGTIETTINHGEELPIWMTEGRTVLIPKTSPPSADPSKYRPITCLPIIYKIYTSVISKLMWQHISANNILHHEQKGCVPGSLGCKEQLLIDNLVLSHASKYQRNLSCAWIDFAKAYDSLSHRWLIKMLELYRFHPNIITAIATTMQTWRLRMTLRVNSVRCCFASPSTRFPQS